MRFSIPKGMLMGVSTASMQIEGGQLDTNWNDWYQKGHIKDGTDPATGKAMNATKIKLNVQEELLALFREAETLTGEVEIRLYEVNPGEFSVHLADEMVDTIFGGIITASEDVANTDTVEIDGETVSIANKTSLKSGVPLLTNYNIILYTRAREKSSTK